MVVAFQLIAVFIMLSAIAWVVKGVITDIINYNHEDKEQQVPVQFPKEWLQKSTTVQVVHTRQVRLQD